MRGFAHINHFNIWNDFIQVFLYSYSIWDFLVILKPWVHLAFMISNFVFKKMLTLYTFLGLYMHDLWWWSNYTRIVVLKDVHSKCWSRSKMYVKGGGGGVCWKVLFCFPGGSSRPILAYNISINRHLTFSAVARWSQRF